MEIVIILIIAAAIGLFWLGSVYIGRPMVRWVEGGRLRREAETQMYKEMNWARAQQQAADKILRRSGQKP